MDRRAARLNRWLQVVGVVLTFFAVVVAIGGLIAFDEFRQIQRRALNALEQIEKREQVLRDTETKRLDVPGLERVSTLSGELRPGRSTEETVPLPGAGDYWLAGSCDRNCTDLDLILSGGGVELDSDVLLDDVPVVRHHATGIEDVSLRVHMVDCAVDSCAWDVGLYRPAL